MLAVNSLFLWTQGALSLRAFFRQVLTLQFTAARVIVRDHLWGWIPLSTFGAMIAKLFSWEQSLLI